MDEREAIIEEVRKMTPDSGNYRIQNVHPDFLGGTLYVVGFDHNDEPFHNYVFSSKSGLHLSKNEALLLSWISKKTKSKNWLEHIGGIAGVIGLLITICIIYIVIWQPDREIPDILSGALTIILGFYFGTHINRSA